MKEIDVKRIVGEVAARHGVLVEENDPLMVALSANGVILEALARELLDELRAVSARLEDVTMELPDEMSAALKQAAEYAAGSVRRGLEQDIEEPASRLGQSWTPYIVHNRAPRCGCGLRSVSSLEWCSLPATLLLAVSAGEEEDYARFDRSTDHVSRAEGDMRTRSGTGGPAAGIGVPGRRGGCLAPPCLPRRDHGHSLASSSGHLERTPLKCESRDVTRLAGGIATVRCRQSLPFR